MPVKDQRVDAYIEKSRDFAKPVLKHLRKLFHKASPMPPDDVIIKLVRQAVELNEKGIKVQKKVSKEKKEAVVPDVLLEALARNETATETFNNFSQGSRREYVEWINGAKTDATRDKRLATTIEWLSEGKRRNWKYEKC